MVKVLLIVVQGKPEGKTIPIVGPIFRIGRGEDCHLRPNSEEISRRHCEIAISEAGATVRDLGSRNGTRINGKPITGDHSLKSGELLQIGPLTFAIAIQGEVAAAPQAGTPQPPAEAKRAGGPSLDDLPGEQIDAWLVSDNARPTPDRPSGVYDGDTLTIDAYREGSGSKPKSSGSVPKAKTPPPAPAPEPQAEPEVNPFEAALEGFEPLPEGAGDGGDPAASSAVSNQNEAADEPPAAEESDQPEELVDESNPFYAAKKGQTPGADTAAAAAKADYKDTSDAASDILRKMLDRRRGAGKS